MSFMQRMRQRFAAPLRFLSKLPGFSKPESSSLHFLNLSQFCGALNDNLYKFVLIFFLIRLEGKEHSGQILSAAGAIFVIPFLLFSSLAGSLADRYSKSQLIVWIKVLEIITIALAIPFFAFGWKWASYLLLFLLSTQSTFFSPPKYGILPELVPKERLSKANGLITSSTYLAIICGTFLASFLTEIFDYHFTWIAVFCVAIALLGFITSLGIKHTPAPVHIPSSVSKRPFFFKNIFQTVVACTPHKHLRSSLFVSSYFLFIGAFAQLNVIPFALVSLNLPEWVGGYLFLATAFGIACGSLLCGKISKKGAELGLSVGATFFLSVFFLLLGKAEGHLFSSFLFLFCLGFFGGLFIVPLETFIQEESPKHLRGNIIAAANFFSFLGVLCASFALYVFQSLLGFSPTQGFLAMGALSFFMFLLLLFRFSDLFLSYTAKKIGRRLYTIETIGSDLVLNNPHPFLILENGSPLKGWLLSGIVPDLHFLFPQYQKRTFPWFTHLFYSLHRISSSEKFETLLSVSKPFLRAGHIPCIYLAKKRPIPDSSFFNLSSFFHEKKEYAFFIVDCKKEKRKITIRFSSF